MVTIGDRTRRLKEKVVEARVCVQGDTGEQVSKKR